MDAAQEARSAEITVELQKRGADAVSGDARRALVDELGALLSGPEQAPTLLAPEKQARADEITGRLRDHALGKPSSYLDVFEKGQLVDELVQLTGAGKADVSPANPSDSQDILAGAPR